MVENERQRVEEEDEYFQKTCRKQERELLSSKA